MSGVNFDVLNQYGIPDQDSDIAEWTKAAQKIGSNMNSAEEELVKILNSDDKKGLEAAQIKYDQAVRMWEFFSTIAKNMHEAVMNVIRRLGIN